MKRPAEVKKASVTKKEATGKDERKGDNEGYGMNLVEVHTVEHKKEQTFTSIKPQVQAGTRTSNPPVKPTKGAPGHNQGVGAKLMPPKKRPAGKRSDTSSEEEQQYKGARVINNP